MKIFRILTTIVLTIGLTASLAFAVPDAANTPNRGNNQETRENLKKDKKDRDKSPRKRLKCKPDKGKECKDPLEALQKKKEKVQQLLKEGKITKEKADEINDKIDSRMKEIEEFNNLPLDQKKQKLNEKFKESLDRKLKDGKLTKEEADKLIDDFNKKIEEWDGKGYPKFYNKGLIKKGKKS